MENHLTSAHIPERKPAGFRQTHNQQFTRVDSNINNTRVLKNLHSMINREIQFPDESERAIFMASDKKLFGRGDRFRNGPDSEDIGFFLGIM